MGGRHTGPLRTVSMGTSATQAESGTLLASEGACTQGGRRCGMGMGTRTTSVVGIVLILVLPFAIPVAMTRVVRTFDGNEGVLIRVRDGLGRMLGMTKNAGSRGGMDMGGYAVRENVGRVWDKDVRKAVNVSGMGMGGMDVKPVRDVWSRYAVVRHGNLYLSETFEQRLNTEVAGRLYRQYPDIFGATEECRWRESVGFALSKSPRIAAEVEIVARCGEAVHSSCTMHAQIEDLRRLYVNVGLGETGHFVTADETRYSSRVRWGPLRGPLIVRLRDWSVMAFRRFCDGQVVNTRVLGVAELKGLLGPGFEVFEYNGQPRHHIRESRGGGV